MERGKFKRQSSTVGKRLLIIHQGALGDFILTFPAIIRLQKYFDAIDVLCQSGIGRLTKTLGIVDNCYPLEAAHVSSLFADQVDSKIKTFLKPYTNIILFTFSEKLKQTIHHITSVPLCCISPKPPDNMQVHLTEFVMENLENCRLIKRTDAVVDDIPLPKRASQPKHQDRILLHPGAGSHRKRWPITHFLEVEAMLKSDGLKPEFILGPAEEDLVDGLQQPDWTVHTLTDLLDLSGLLESAGGYIGNDSGPSHLAAFIGLPVVVIFGPADPERWAPMGRNAEIVKPEMACRPCFETEKTNCDDPKCLTKTTPQQVIRAFYRKYGVF
jgi:ADP-heptose:LPS heptosyltransferase